MLAGGWDLNPTPAGDVSRKSLFFYRPMRAIMLNVEISDLKPIGSKEFVKKEEAMPCV